VLVAKREKKERKKGNLKINIEQLPARIELATFRLRSERTTTMLRKRLMVLDDIIYNLYDIRDCQIANTTPTARMCRPAGGEKVYEL
jgi:hypothetical protein